MLQVDEADTFVLATNRTETVRDFVTLALRRRRYRNRLEGKRGGRDRQLPQDGQGTGKGQPEVLSSGEVDPAHRGPCQGPAETRLEAGNGPREPLPYDGRSRPAPERSAMRPSDAKPMRVLVTGHKGFTGRYVTDALRTSGHEVLGSAQQPGDLGSS